MYLMGMNSYLILLCIEILILNFGFKTVETYMPQLLNDGFSVFDSSYSRYFDEYITSDKVMGAIPVSEYDRKLNLGDVLVDNSSEIFFYISSSISDSNNMKLIRASTGSSVLIHDVTSFLLIKFCESIQNKPRLNYKNVPEVMDEFIIIQDYEDYILLGSIGHSIIFVAPSVTFDSFIRNEFNFLIKKKSLMKTLSSISTHITRNEDISKKGDAVKCLTQSLMSDSESSSDGDSDCESHVSNSASSSTSTSDSSTESDPDIGEEGPTLKFEQGDVVLNREYATETLVSLLKEKKLSIENSISILRAAEKVFREDDMIEYIFVKKEKHIVIVGDIHGQFLDLLRIFKRCGWPSKDKMYLFNGDIVDRGDYSIECLILLYALKITCPNHVFINRGNHESEMCKPGRFYKDSMKFDPTGAFYREAQRGFVALPVASVINFKIYVVHGGIRDDYYIYDISELDRFNLSKYTEKFVYTCLWDDPSSSKGIRENEKRGGRCKYFGPDVTRNFLIYNRFKIVIRSHTYAKNGFLKSHNDQLWTIFSAPNYCGRGNQAAVLVLNHRLERRVIFFRSRNHDEGA